MLSDKRGILINKFVSDYVLFDLETTGISPNTDEVVEIAGVKVINSEVAGEFVSLVNPGIQIPYAVSQINNITNEMVADSPDFRTVLADFLEFVGDLPLVGHNIHSFDMKFIYRDSEKYWGKTPDNDYIDTLYISRKVLPHLAHHRLADLSVHYGISTEGAHRALADCLMNQKVYDMMSKETVEDNNVRSCPKCGSLMVIRNGKFGEFWGCTAYPNCKCTFNC